MMHSAKVSQMVSSAEHRGHQSFRLEMSLKTIPNSHVQIQKDFTELFLRMHSTKIAQMVPIYWTKGLPEL